MSGIISRRSVSVSKGDVDVVDTEEEKTQVGRPSLQTRSPNKRDEKRGSTTGSKPQSSSVKVAPEDLPELPPVTAPIDEEPFETQLEEDSPQVRLWRDRIVELEKEVSSRGDTIASLDLRLEIGRIYEERLGSLKEAAVVYQTAFKLSEKELDVLHASRRLFAIVGNWEMVIQILGCQISQTNHVEYKATLLAEKGLLLEQKLTKQDEAQTAFEQALSIWPIEPIALSSLERYYRSAANYSALLEMYERALSAERQPKNRLQLLLSSAQLAEDQLGLTEKAISLYEEANKVDSSLLWPLFELQRLYSKVNRTDLLVSALERTARATKNMDEAGQYVLTASRLSRDTLSRPDEAIRLIGTLQSEVSSLAVLEEAESLYRDLGKFDEVLGILRKAADVEVSQYQKINVYRRLAALLEKREDSAGAVEVYRKILELDKTHLVSVQALGRLLEKLKQYDELEKLYLHELEHLVLDNQARVRKLFALARLRINSLEKEDEGIEALKQLLGLKADYNPARRLLEDIYQRRGSWSELVAHYQQNVELTTDVEQKLYLLGQIAFWAEDKLKDLQIARAATHQIIELSPTSINALRTLARLCEALQDYPALVTCLQSLVQVTAEQSTKVALMYRIGIVQLEKLSNVEAAQLQLEELLDINPCHLPTLRSLGRVYASQKNWTSTLRMYERELQQEQSGEVSRQIDLLFRMAQVLSENLLDNAGAAERYQKILGLDDTNVAAARALTRCSTDRNEAYGTLVTVLINCIEKEIVSSPQETARVLLEAAQVSEHKLDKPQQAADNYLKVLNLGYEVESVSRALYRILAAAGEWEKLVSVLEQTLEKITEDDVRLVKWLVQKAQIHTDKLKQFDIGASLLEQALELAPESVNIMEQLESVSIVRGDWKKAVKISEVLTAAEKDKWAYASRHVKLASIKEKYLQVAPEEVAEHYRLALTAIPSHPVAQLSLEHAYLTSRNWEGLVVLYTREAMLTRDQTRKSSLFCRAAHLCLDQLEDVERGGRLFDQALEALPSSLVALQGRRRVAVVKKEYKQHLALLSREEAVLKDSELLCELQFDRGRVYQEGLSSLDQAVSAYRAVLSLNPRHETAFARLKGIYEQKEKYGELLALLDARADAVNVSEEKATLLESGGQIAEEKLKQSEQAINRYRLSLEQVPSNPSVLTRLGPLLVASQNWDDAIVVFEQTLKVVDEPKQVRDIYKSLGGIYRKHRVDLIRCVQSYQFALQADSSDIECLEQLAALYKGAQDWSSAVNVLLRLAEAHPRPAGKVRTLIELSDVYLQGSKDRKQAIIALRKAVEIDPRSAEVLRRLIKLHEEEGDWSALVEVAGAYVRLLGPEDRKKAASIHLRMAVIFEQKLNDEVRAINALRYALEGVPDDRVALERLAHLYSKNEATFPKAVDIHRRLLSLNPFRVESYHEIYRMFAVRGELDKAFVAAEILVFLRAQTQEEDLFYQEHKMLVPQTPDGEMRSEDYHRAVLHPHEFWATHAIIGTVAAELGKVFPGELDRYELKREDRHSARSGNPVRQVADEVASVLEVSMFDLWFTNTSNTGVFVESEKVPAVIVGQGFARRVPAKDQRFLLGRALGRIKSGYQLFQAVSPEMRPVLFSAILALANPRALTLPDTGDLDVVQRRILKSISSRTRRLIEEMGRHLDGKVKGYQAYRDAMICTANRAGFVLSNDIEVAVRNIARDHANMRSVFSDARGAAETLGGLFEVRDLLCYAMSEAYFHTRVNLGFSIQS